jgi:hypothetical protein
MFKFVVIILSLGFVSVNVPAQTWNSNAGELIKMVLKVEPDKVKFDDAGVKIG